MNGRGAWQCKWLWGNGSGLTLEQIKDELLNGRDLSKKGNHKRQVEYAERTARKASEQFEA